MVRMVMVAASYEKKEIMMKSRDFCFWLQGFFEIGKPTERLTKEQLELIRKHLYLVFEHEIDPSMGDEEHQEKLNNIHESKLRC